MKKVLFLQIEGNALGGVWSVNKTIGESLIEEGYDVEIMSIRDSHSGKVLEHDPKLKVSIINTKDKWNITHFEDIKSNLFKFKLFKSFKLLLKKVIEEFKLKRDYNRVKKYIISNDIDYIVTTHYQLLDVIPKRYLSRTIHEQHTSFGATYSHKATRKMLYKYNGKVKYLWLTKATCDKAIECGYLNSTYIYNPVQFSSLKTADVVSNKKLVTLSRISSEKRIDLMIKIVDDILKDDKFKDWSLEIYGEGDLRSSMEKTLYNKDKIKFMGTTNTPRDVIMKSSINLCTSSYEGFSMSILEANECGVPTVTFNFGESVSEEIIQDKTGIYVEQDDVNSYKKELIKLMSNVKKLEKMSLECKKFANKFNRKNIVKEWIKLFDSFE